MRRADFLKLLPFVPSVVAEARPDPYEGEIARVKQLEAAIMQMPVADTPRLLAECIARLEALEEKRHIRTVTLW